VDYFFYKLTFLLMTFGPLILLGYFLGSVPFGLILTRAFGAGDIRNIGSGNIGATNVLRTGRKGLAAATLLLDMGKGALAVFLFSLSFWGLAVGWTIFAPTGGNASVDVVVGPLGNFPTLLSALAALIGHCYPVWLRFKGGKGVATMLGISFALAWPIGVISALVWLGGMLLTKISSVGGMASAVAAPIVAFAIGQYEMAVVLALMAAIVIWKHRANIARLRAGTEPRIGAKS